ncbi:MAG: zinc metallopeptidase [Paludibacteraceae bacterium]|nr:zinc metallopeptidase [Paludibacteraceae bacterium]MBQ2190760.1 zinc metallopeptidase [Paludibacteraceae bacterium]MBQ2519691.1 zinc metallopeptidase [Paludibacteraceae bacterium]MBQ4017705.1 zinc metallopeptidase [Paludibacteraceae bacterium]MBQ5379122.1 zinc metallopeptidase [Paludibacteraceae bacterium]
MGAEEQIVLSPTAIYWIIFIGIAIASWVVSAALERKFKKYSEQPLKLTGREIAEKMLRDNDIYDVKVTSISGQLTDHYNPTTKTVNLSEAVYNGANVAAAAVAAHECGHAVQHQEAYAPLQMRSALVPVVSFAGKWVMWILLIGMLTINAFPQLMLIGIGLFALTTLFSFITLPVEVNASQRAVNWLQSAGITDRETTKMASDALHSAAYTYVVAALSSLATLLYYVMIFMGGRRK